MARILIADDEEMDRVFLDEVLSPAGHALLFAKEGESALSAYREHDVDVVIADLIMPGVDGLRLIQELERVDPAVCVIAVTAGSEELLEKARELGAVATLAKPVVPQDLLEAVERAERERDRRADPWA